MLVVLAFVRYVLPFVCIVAGVLVFWLAPGSSRFVGAGAFIGAGLSVFALNVLFRLSVRDEAERDDEERARRFFDAHGYWPDEARRVLPDERRTS
jgi:hypothetical protein